MKTINRIRRVLKYLYYHLTMREIKACCLIPNKIPENFMSEYLEFKFNLLGGKSEEEQFNLVKENIISSMIMSNQDKFDFGNIDINYKYQWFDEKNNKIINEDE